MNILFVHPNLCKRAYNQIYAVNDYTDHNSYLLYGHPDTSAINLEKEIEKICVEFKKKILPIKYPYSWKKNCQTIKKYCKKWDIDLIHSYSMPDDVTMAAIKSAQVPVINDVRDVATTFSKEVFSKMFSNNFFMQKILGWISYTYAQSIEKKVMEKSDATVFSTKCMLEYAKKRYKLKEKNIVFLNYALEKESCLLSKEKFSKIKGGMHVGFTGNINIDMAHRNFLPLFKKLADERIHVHMHVITRTNESLSACKKIAENNNFLHYYPPMPMSDILKELSKCDYGLLPFPTDKEKKYVDTILPNKLFDYLIAGLPIASSNVQCAKRFLEEQNVGFIYQDVEDLVTKLKQKTNTFYVDPKEFFIEKHIGKLDEFYKEIVDKN